MLKHKLKNFLVIFGILFAHNIYAQDDRDSFPHDDLAKALELEIPELSNNKNSIKVIGEDILIKLKETGQWKKATLWTFDLENGSQIKDNTTLPNLEKRLIEIDGKLYSIRSTSGDVSAFLIRRSSRGLPLEKFIQHIDSMVMQQSPDKTYISKELKFVQFGNGEVTLQENKNHEIQLQEIKFSSRPFKNYEFNLEHISVERPTDFEYNPKSNTYTATSESKAETKTTALINKEFIMDFNRGKLTTYTDSVVDPSTGRIGVEKTTEGRLGKEKLVLNETASEQKREEWRNTGRDTIAPSIKGVELPLSRGEFDLSPKEINALFDIEGDRHNYPEQSVRSAALNTLTQFTPQTILFYAAIGATSWIDSTASHKFNKAENDPLWDSHFLQQTASPLGLVSFFAFVMASSAVHTGSMVGINKIFNTIEGQKQQARGKILTNSNFHGKDMYNRAVLDRLNTTTTLEKRAIKTLKFSTVPLALTAGMLVSSMIHEFWADPNVIACQEGLKNANKRTSQFLAQCDLAYSEWVVTNKLVKWMPDLAALILAATASHSLLKGIGYGISKIPSSKHLVTHGYQTAPHPTWQKQVRSFVNQTRLRRFTAGGLYGFASIFAFLSIHRWMTDPWIARPFKEKNFQKIIPKKREKTDQYINTLYDQNKMDQISDPDCILSKLPIYMTDEEIEEYLSSRDSSVSMSPFLSWLSSAFGWSKHKSPLPKRHKAQKKCLNQNIIHTVNEQFTAESNLRGQILDEFYRSFGWISLAQTAYESFSNQYQIFKSLQSKEDFAGQISALQKYIQKNKSALKESSHSLYTPDGYSEYPVAKIIWNMACGRDLSKYDEIKTKNIIQKMVKRNEPIEHSTYRLPLLTKYEKFYVFTMPKLIQDTPETRKATKQLCKASPEVLFNSHSHSNPNPQHQKLYRQTPVKIFSHLDNSIKYKQNTWDDKTYGPLMDFVFQNLDPKKLESDWWDKKSESQFLLFMNILEKDYKIIIRNKFLPSSVENRQRLAEEVDHLLNTMKLIHQDSLTKNPADKIIKPLREKFSLLTSTIEDAYPDSQDDILGFFINTQNSLLNDQLTEIAQTPRSDYTAEILQQQRKEFHRQKEIIDGYIKNYNGPEHPLLNYFDYLAENNHLFLLSLYIRIIINTSHESMLELIHNSDSEYEPFAVDQIYYHLPPSVQMGLRVLSYQLEKHAEIEQQCSQISSIMDKENIIENSRQNLKTNFQNFETKEPSLTLINVINCLQSLVGFPSLEAYKKEWQDFAPNQEYASQTEIYPGILLEDPQINLIKFYDSIFQPMREMKSNCLNPNNSAYCILSKFTYRDQLSIAIHKRLSILLNEWSTLKFQTQLISEYIKEYTDEDKELLQEALKILQ